MPINLGLLSDAALEGLNPDTKDALQQQATKQFLIGSLLGGDPSMAFRSATGVPADYFARQQQVQAQQQQQQLLGARNASYERVGLPYVQGSEQEKMLAQDVADFGPDAARTYAALESNKNLPKKFNQEKFAGLASEILAGTDPKGWAEFNKNIRPQSYEPGTIVTNPFDPTKIITQMPGGLEKGMQWGKNPQTGLPEVQMMPGFVGGVAARTAAETSARESNTPRQVPGASGAPTFIYPTAPAGTGFGGAGSGAERPQTASDIAQNKAAEDRFTSFSKTAYENAQTAPTRKQSSEFLYSAADKMDPNAATPFFAETAGYLRVIPGVGDKFDSFVGDYKLMNQTRSKNILTGFQSVKGNANPQEVKIVEDAANNPVKDPKWSTKWVSALEIATADKDLAKDQFVSSYRGEARNVTNDWANSPQNPRIYNHPKVEQFLVEQIRENPTAPILPAGFKLVQSGNRYGVRKPDGSVMPLQLGQ